MSAEPAESAPEKPVRKRPAKKATTEAAASAKKVRKQAPKKSRTPSRLARGAKEASLMPKEKGYTPVSRRPGAPSMIVAAKKEAEAFELRAAGMTYQQIADQLQYNDGGAARKAVMRVLERTVPDSMEYVRRMEVRRLDALWRPLYVQALRGDRLAADRCIKIMERRAAMLGLDAPIRIQQMVITEEQLDEAIERIEAEADALEARSWSDGEDIPAWDDEDGDDGLAGVPVVV